MRLSFSFIVAILIFSSCNSGNKKNNSNDEINNLIENHKKRIEFLEEQLYNPSYDWFAIGNLGHHIVQTRFYVSLGEYKYENNGYTITGFIANLTSMPMEQVNIVAAIKDKNDDSYTKGNKEYDLPVGDKIPFEIFIPTSETNVKEVGIKIESWRM